MLLCGAMSPASHDLDPASPSRSDVARGLAVHMLTASGAGFGLLALAAAIERRFALCFAWLGAALLVDGLDGALARRLRASETAAFIDGALLDLVVDYLTYVVVPLIALWRSDLAPRAPVLACAWIVACASALYFADRRMKTADLWFRGLPACWNVVVFYLFAFRPPAWATLAVLLVGAALMFAPIAGVHPLRVRRLRALTIAATLLWLASAAATIERNFSPSFMTQTGLALSGLYFVALSVWRGRPDRSLAPFEG